MFQISWLKKLSVIYVRVRKCVCSTQTQIHSHIRICVCVFLVCTHNPFKQKHSLAIVRTHWEAGNVYAMLWNRKTSPRDNWGHDSYGVYMQCREPRVEKWKQTNSKRCHNNYTISLTSPGVGPVFELVVGNSEKKPRKICVQGWQNLHAPSKSI